MFRYQSRFTFLLLTFLFFSGCGSKKTTIVSPDGPVIDTWQADVFLPSDMFKDLCRQPRPPQTGQPFQDMEGMLLDELNWVRSYNDEVYFWYEDVDDVDPGSFDDPIAYFDVLKTNELSPSGRAIDEFHFTQNTQEFIQFIESGLSFGYGISYENIDPVQTTLVVSYVDNASPYKNLIPRGSQLVSVAGIRLDGQMISPDQADEVSRALLPTKEGIINDFGFLNRATLEEFTVSLESSLIQADPVDLLDIIDTPSGNVGYILFNDHNAIAEDQLINAVNQLSVANVTDLVLDLRLNGGGLLSVASQLAYMVAGSQTQNQIFERIRFNDKQSNQDVSFPFLATRSDEGADIALPTLNLNRLYVLTSGGTCSASEAIINGLRGIDVEVILIGGKTCGKPFGFFAQDNCSTTYFTVQFVGENAKGFSGFADGFTANISDFGAQLPGCSVQDEYSAALGDPSEALLSAALNYRETGLCPQARRLRPLEQKPFIEPSKVLHLYHKARYRSEALWVD